jgi:hypothetical protein
MKPAHRYIDPPSPRSLHVLQSPNQLPLEALGMWACFFFVCNIWF